MLVLRCFLAPALGFAVDVPAWNLPIPDHPPEAVVGPTLASSVNKAIKKPKTLREDAPNIVLIMNDDVGFGAADAFGGPVHTPTLTRLAASGISYNRFHTTAMCSPTRASLLTGRNHHTVSSGVITELASGFPGYTGKIPKSAATIARVLSAHGYDTAAFGKWHNTPLNDLYSNGPFDQYPTGLGFGYFYGFLAGETSQYEPRLYENTKPIEPPYTPEQGYHLTEDLASQALKFIRANRALAPDRPFFIYFAPGGTHSPHHINATWADKYKGHFDMGWEELRKKIFAKQQAMGWIPKTAKLTAIDATMTKWKDVPEHQRPFQLRLMELYAGFLEHTDVQNGKIVDELERQGLIDNTLIIYLLGDNGASAEGLQGTIAELLEMSMGLPHTIDQQLDYLKGLGGLDALGSKHVENMYHSSFAWAMDTPFKSTKLVAAHFGGTRTPMVISWPKVIKHDKEPRPQFHHVCDIAPTIYEAIGIREPGQVDGIMQDPLNGISMVYTFDSASTKERRFAQYFELMGSRGVYKDGWFAGTLGPRIPWAPDPKRMKMWDPDQDVWELYDLNADYSQAHDLAETEPQKLAEMKQMFLTEAALNKVLPVGAALYSFVYHPEEAPRSPLTSWNLFQGMTRIAESNAPLFRTGFSSLASLVIELPPQNAQGVLYCVGGSSAGFTLYIDDGDLYVEYKSTVLYPYKAKSAEPLQPGENRIEIRLIYEKMAPAAPADLTMTVNCKLAASMRIEKSMTLFFDASETFDVGVDLGAPVSRQYEDRLPFAFNGKISSLNIKYIGASDGDGEGSCTA